MPPSSRRLLVGLGWRRHRWRRATARRRISVRHSERDCGDNRCRWSGVHRPREHGFSLVTRSRIAIAQGLRETGLLAWTPTSTFAPAKPLPSDCGALARTALSGGRIVSAVPVASGALKVAASPPSPLISHSAWPRCRLFAGYRLSQRQPQIATSALRSGCRFSNGMIDCSGPAMAARSCWTGWGPAPFRSRPARCPHEGDRGRAPRHGHRERSIERPDVYRDITPPVRAKLDGLGAIYVTPFRGFTR